MTGNRQYGSKFAVAVSVERLPLVSLAAGELEVKIGLTGPLTDPQAAIGKDHENGVKLARDRLNAQGIVVGGKKVRFILQSEDDAADPRTGMTVVQRRIDADVKTVLGRTTLEWRSPPPSCSTMPVS
ncbi:ABC transporter substrate-binding protein [Vogesella sp. GCM10023246]|uniref:ABC transporter substrate-binding protein n=1 Tax=Vogesella oryzagri TaxID=3160864 RepID=A0ABV1M7H2_9NEIS